MHEELRRSFRMLASCEAVRRMAWIALFSASLILGGVSACPAAAIYRWCRACDSRRGVGQNSRP
jgi:hypothetical protein